MELLRLKKEHLAYFGIILTVGLAGLQFTESLKSIAVFPQSVLTVWTMLSVCSVFAFFAGRTLKQKKRFLSTAGVIQGVSLLLLLTEKFSSFPFLVPSSITTSLYLFLVIFTLTAKEIWRLNYLTDLLLPLVSFIPILFVIALVYARHDLLGAYKNITGLGTSPFTTVCFLAIVLNIKVAYHRVISFKLLNIHPRPYWVFTVVAAVILLKLVFLPETFEGFYFKNLTLDVFVLACVYWYVAHPLSYRRDSRVIVCAWTKKVKLSSDDWLPVDEFFAEMGIDVSHGMAPEVESQHIS